jgi:hypothetical protein
MRYLIVRNNIVINVVEYLDTPPAVTSDTGDDVVPDPTGTTNVGDAFDIQAYRSVQARDTAVAEVSNTDYMGKVIRALANVLVGEINILREQIIGIATAVWDPASMTSGTGLTSPNMTVVGAQFGDIVDVAAPYSLAGIVATGYVSAVNTVNVRLTNLTGSAVNLASGTWTVIVRRHSFMADRTLAQFKTAMQNQISSGSVD